MSKDNFEVGDNDCGDTCSGHRRLRSLGEVRLSNRNVIPLAEDAERYVSNSNYGAVH